jgi:sorbitol-specific phosphotransferase system component IIC
MIKDFFGLLKMILSISILLYTLLGLVPSLMIGVNTGSLEMGRLLLDFLPSLFYASYLFYSGWTEFRAKTISVPMFIWIGIAVGIYEVHFCFSSDALTLYVLGGILTIIAGQEIIRMLAKTRKLKNKH